MNIMRQSIRSLEKLRRCMLVPPIDQNLILYKFWSLFAYKIYIATLRT